MLDNGCRGPVPLIGTDQLAIPDWSVLKFGQAPEQTVLPSVFLLNINFAKHALAGVR